MNKNSLNDTLRAWAQRRECSEERLQALTDGILASLPRRLSSASPMDEQICRNFGLWPKLAYISLGAAAMLAVMGGYNFVRSQVALPVSVPYVLPANYAVAKARVVSDVNRLFAGQLRWVTENNGDIRIGVENEAGAIDPKLASAWIQTVVVTRQAGETTWRTVWSTAVQVNNDERIELPSPNDPNERLMFWAYAVDKEKWAIDFACVLTTPIRLSSESSEIIETGKYQEIAALKTEDREYRVFQTVLNMKPERNS